MAGKSCSINLEKLHKRTMHKFGDVSGLIAWYSYCEHGICDQILSVIYFKFFSYTFAHLSIGLSAMKGAMF